MSKIKLPHASGNSMSIGAPATNPASDLELKLPATIGSAGQVLKNSDTAGTLEFGPPPRTHRNLIINGACNVAQRGTSATVSSNGYLTVDRFYTGTGGEDEDVTSAQGTVASGTTPYNLGFRNSYKVTNGNQTSGAGASDYCEIMYQVEAQDVANSGWNYTSASSYITLSFWVKSSVAQNFYGFFLTRDGTNRNYPFETGSLSADTWTKITKTIPGSTNVQFDNNNGQGITLEILPFYGTTYTNNSSAVNTWMNWDGNAACPDNTSTWWTTNDATFEITGLQLEVGDTATEFEHRSYGYELARCQRYFFVSGASSDRTYQICGGNGSLGSGYLVVNCPFPVTMRAQPTCEAFSSYGEGTAGLLGTNGNNRIAASNTSMSSTNTSATNVRVNDTTSDTVVAGAFLNIRAAAEL